MDSTVKEAEKSFKCGMFLLCILIAGIFLMGCNIKHSDNNLSSIDAFADLNIGDTLTFGRYEQDNDFDNGDEPIEWQVLAVEDGRALLISSYALDSKPYNQTYINVTWRSSTLRKWLNGEFLSKSFSDAEQTLIAEVKNTNLSNPSARTRGGGDTKDKIFLLSIDEANRYFPDDEARQCEASAHAKANGAYIGENGKSWWWLRSPGRSGSAAAIVLYEGYVTNLGYGVGDPCNVVRPALWLDLQH